MDDILLQAVEIITNVLMKTKTVVFLFKIVWLFITLQSLKMAIHEICATDFSTLLQVTLPNYNKV